MTLLLEADPHDCRARLIQAAAEVFVEEGYRASVERVAARAGVARQTLYNHFPCKADLFGEVVRQSTAVLLITLDANQQTLRERLLRFGAMYREKVLSAEGLGFFRTLAAETVRFPELAASFYRSGPAQTAARLSVVLKEAMSRSEMRSAPPNLLPICCSRCWSAPTAAITCFPVIRPPNPTRSTWVRSSIATCAPLRPLPQKRPYLPPSLSPPDGAFHEKNSFPVVACTPGRVR